MKLAEIMALDDEALARLAGTPLMPGFDFNIDGEATSDLASDVFRARGELEDRAPSLKRWTAFPRAKR